MTDRAIAYITNEIELREEEIRQLKNARAILNYQPHLARTSNKPKSVGFMVWDNPLQKASEKIAPGLVGYVFETEEAAVSWRECYRSSTPSILAVFA